uniref:Retrovirus-related Pol polyprotein from transposon TNT 1-94 n=1 Tax=Cajanus cajan TaxID=3821 RepID=A0A151SE76_CAJCA|nr:hypothetical protein KK1_024916 [Cajanus cajan]
MLHTKFQNLRKKNQLIFEYILHIKAIINVLCSIDDLVSIQKLLYVIVKDLLEEYDSLINLVTNRLEPYDLNELKALLLA